MRLDLLKTDRFWKWVLWIGVGFFALSRLLTFSSFPIFNDEAIYLQYSQAIHEDFGKYKFISEGGLYADWKPPLQFWIGSLFMGAVKDPLAAGRTASLIVSFFGLWGLYLFVKEFLGKREAAGAVLLYALCPPALFFNNQFVAETYVLSFAPWVYWWFLRAIRTDKIRPWYLLGAAVFGALLTLSKQSGALYLYLAVLLPLISFAPADKKTSGPRWDWKGFFIRIGLVFGGVILALIFRKVGVSSASTQVQERFDSNWLMSVTEIFALPVKIWKTNLAMVWDYYLHYYTVFMLLPILYFFFVALRRWDPRKTILALGFLGGGAAVILLLRGFNEYIYNTAVIIFLLPSLAVSFFAAWRAAAGEDSKNSGTWRLPRIAAAAVLASFLIMLGHWAYQDALMKASPVGYIQRSTPWAIANYIDNWSGGFGVKEAIGSLKAQEGPGIVLADPQWGNPRTALEVYNPSYWNLRVIGLTSDFQTPEGTQAARAYILEQPFKTRLVIFSAARNETRAVWQDNVERYLCDSRTEIQVVRNQPPIVICSF